MKASEIDWWECIEKAILARKETSSDSWQERAASESRELAKLYKSRAPSAEYSDPDVQNAYQLKYFPSYFNLSLLALAEISEETAHRFTHARQVVIVGGGPLPELAALLAWLHFVLHFLKLIAFVMLCW